MELLLRQLLRSWTVEQTLIYIPKYCFGVNDPDTANKWALYPGIAGTLNISGIVVTEICCQYSKDQVLSFWIAYIVMSCTFHEQPCRYCPRCNSSSLQRITCFICGACINVLPRRISVSTHQRMLLSHHQQLE